MTNRRIVLAARPQGEPRDEDFRMEESPVPRPGDGQVLVRTIYLSLVRDLGFDAAVDHRADGFDERLVAACPAGIDVYFENVGGKVLRAVVPLLNQFARLPICGLIAYYSATHLPQGPDLTPQLMRAILVKRLTLRGFIVSDFAAQWPDFARAMTAWVREGRVKYREDVVDGLEHAVGAFQGLLQGRNFGKLLVRVGAPTR